MQNDQIKLSRCSRSEFPSDGGILRSGLKLGVFILLWIFLSIPSLAQVANPSTKQCIANALDRTIHLCDAGGSHLPNATTMRAYAKSSAGITSFQLWMDGVKKFDTATLADKASLFTSAGTNEDVNAPGRWHRFVFIAHDSIGDFRKAVYYFLGNSNGTSVPCPPTDSEGIKLCNLNSGDTVNSPVSVTFVVNSPSEIIQNIGARSEDPNNGGASVGYSGDANTVGATATLHLPSGTHTLTFQGELENRAITKTVTVHVR